MAKRFGWRHVSTDSLARHPGLPWKTEARSAVPQHVSDHYLSLSVDELITDVMGHYEKVWPRIEQLVVSHIAADSGAGLIVEGSAVLPERAAALDRDRIAVLWLTADPALLKARIHASSGFERCADFEKGLIAKFVQRNERYDELRAEAANRPGLLSIGVQTADTLGELTERCITLLGIGIAPGPRRVSARHT